MNITNNFKIHQMFSLDLRSLALFRVCLGILIIADLIIRSGDLTAHYADDGCFPRILAMSQYYNTFFWSIHFISGLKEVQAFLFLVSGVFAILLIIGYRTKLSMFISWLLMSSLHVRSSLVLDGGDYLFRLILFWSMFLPLGAKYSVDESLNPPTSKLPNNIFSMSTVALFLQVSFMYWFTVILKWNNNEWNQGYGIYYALSEVQYCSQIGLALLHLPMPTLKFLTYLTMWIETVGPVFLFSPIYTVPLRIIGLISLWAMHIGFGLCLDIEFFPWVDFVSLVPFIPSCFWEKLLAPTKIFENLISSSYFKNVCDLCKKIDAYLFSGSKLFAPREVSIQTLKSTNILVPFLLVYVLFCNLEHITPKYHVPEKLKWVGQVLHIDQWWYMFVPTEKEGVWYNMWYVIPGRLKDSTEVDLFKNGAPVSWEKPKLASELFKNRLWKKYLITTGLVYKSYLPYYAWYLCKDWNSHHGGDKKLDELDIYVMYERVLLDYKTTETQKIFSGKYYCTDVK